MVVQALPTVGQVAAFLDWPSDTVGRIAPHLASVTAFVRSYTRGVGFTVSETVEECEQDLAAVIVSATARSVSNPANTVRVEVGTYSEVFGRFEGFTLAEQYVLHNYRRRTA